MVADTAFVLGSNNLAHLIKVKQGPTIEVGWDKIGAGEDILITKEVIDPSEAKKVASPPATAQSAKESEGGKGRFGIPRMRGSGSQKMTCPSCGKEATWIKQYSRWYCESEKKYV